MAGDGRGRGVDDFADGSGAGAQVQFATIANRTAVTLTYADFIVY